MAFKEICRGVLVMGALFATQTAVFNQAKADTPMTPGASDWTADPTLASQLQPEQKFDKFSVMIPVGYKVESITRTVDNGTETLYRYKGPIRLDKTFPELFVYVLIPSGTAPAWSPSLDNPLPPAAEGVYYWDQSKGAINGVPADYQQYKYRLNGQKHERSGFEFTATDGTETIAIGGLDFSQHTLESEPLLRCSALSLHE